MVNAYRIWMSADFKIHLLSVCLFLTRRIPLQRQFHCYIYLWYLKLTRIIIKFVKILKNAAYFTKSYNFLKLPQNISKQKKSFCLHELTWLLIWSWITLTDLIIGDTSIYFKNFFKKILKALITTVRVRENAI